MNYRNRAIKMIESYINGDISDDDLYYWNCGYTEVIHPEELLEVTWATIHMMNETNPDDKTTDEDLLYLVQCLKNERQYKDEEL